LVAYFLRKFAKGMDISVSDEAMEFLKSKNWRGNVRELENVIARACILSDYSHIKLSHVRDEGETKELKPSSVREMEMKLILETLTSLEGNRTRAASVLGITVRTLRNKINEYRSLGIHVPSGVN
jgi:two-component system response regulator FlrC